MLKRLGDYLLRSVTKEVMTVQKFNRRRACWYDVSRGEPVECELFEGKPVEVDLSRENLSNANLSAEPVEGEYVDCWLDQFIWPFNSCPL